MFKFGIIILAGMLVSGQAKAQYVNSSGDNPAIREYEREIHEMYPDSPEMLNRGIMYIFYDGENCAGCATAIKELYDIYAINYEADYAVFEIDYTQDLGVNFQEIYNLTQPLSVVMVQINNGQAWGYQKIDNLYQYIDNPQMLRQTFMQQVNNFTVPQNII